jgi:hypothetical protein
VILKVSISCALYIYSVAMHVHVANTYTFLYFCTYVYALYSLHTVMNSYLRKKKTLSNPCCQVCHQPPMYVKLLTALIVTITFAGDVYYKPKLQCSA